MIGMTVCSGIGAPEMAAPWIDWKYQSEIERFPAAVLAHHYPDAINHGDMTKFQEWPDHAIDILCGGTPCQSFSVAGLRKGLVDPRGNLALTYLAIADRYRPRWLVWENVPGVLSSNGGRDFGAFLGALGQLRYGFAYRVLDAQYVRTCDFPRAVPQRRRRVFVVGYFGDWRRAAAVLFDGESLRGNPPPRRKAGEGASKGFECGPQGGGQPPAVAFDLNQITSKANRSQPDPAVHHTLPAATTPPHLAHPWAVRRLTPVECERLQGFPDNFTRIPYRNKPADKCPDGPRYKALGNSMAVNVMQWIFQRISKVDAA